MWAITSSSGGSSMLMSATGAVRKTSFITVSIGARRVSTSSFMA
jgi:hypothetical protein